MKTASSAASQSGSSGNESGRSLNQATVDFPTIIFPANSAKVPSSSIPVLRRIAEQIKQLPPGTVAQLNGYTYSKRTSAADMELSQRRADSVAHTYQQQSIGRASSNGTAKNCWPFCWPCRLLLETDHCYINCIGFRFDSCNRTNKINFLVQCVVPSIFASNHIAIMAAILMLEPSHPATLVAVA